MQVKQGMAGRDGAAAKLARAAAAGDLGGAMLYRRMLGPWLLLAAAAGAGLGALVSTDASARTAFQSAYTLDQNYSAALRMIRVDMGFKITEKDPEAAYIMFEYKSSESGNRISSGSIEMVPQDTKVQVVVQLPQMPQYHEEVMASSLKRKLQQDYGDPPKQRPPPKDKDKDKDKGKGDAGADAPEGEQGS